jgi:hypothetical protein
MSGTVDIGAARVHLIVDADEFKPVIAQGKSAMVDFGAAAEAAYDKQTKGARRAVNAVADYVSQLRRMGTGLDAFKGLDTASARIDTLMRKASRAGADKSVLESLAGAWRNYAKEVLHAGAVEENAQRGVDASLAAQKKSQLEAQITLYHRVEQAARDAAQAKSAVERINTITGVSGGGSGLAARDQSLLIAELQRQVQLEDQIEAEAHAINREVGRWQSQLEAIGKDYYEIARINATKQFGANAGPIIAQINALEKANTTMRGTTVNAKQLQQAIRFLPAQFTDIVQARAGESLVICVEPRRDITNGGVRKSERATVLVGPEGGWSSEELARAMAAGASPLVLGPRTLRAETAPLVAMSALWTMWGW